MRRLSIHSCSLQGGQLHLCTASLIIMSIMRLLLLLGLFFCCASATCTQRQLLQTCETYTVVAGDICWDIAEANGITVADLERWNPTVQCSNLQIGEVLCVSEPGGSPSESCRTYTVQAGDICWNIVQVYGISLTDLESWNPGLDCSNLQVGQVLCVSNPGETPDLCPPPAPPRNCTTYAVQSGDFCWAIANSHGISLDDFLSWNPGINCGSLQIGQFVCVSAPGSVAPAPSPPPAEYNGDVFIEYIGALYNGVRFSNVPINTNVSFYFILAFAIDYTSVGGVDTPSDGVFDIYWQQSVITPDAVQAIKAEYSNVKVMVSIGGDTINGQPVLFSPTTVESWVSNAVDSLADLIEQFHLDGIDINYEHFSESASPETFSTCIGQLITQLKERSLNVSVTSIAPFDSIETHYLKLWEDYSSLIDYVNFQFYTYSMDTTAEEYVNLYEVAAAKYGGGSNLLASFNTGNIGPRPCTVLDACRLLQSNGRLPGIFIWSADGSLSSNFVYDRQAQALLAGEEVALYSVA